MDKLVGASRAYTPECMEGVLRSPYTRSCIALAYWTGVQTLPPARLFSSWVLQDHRYEMVDGRVWRQVKDEGRQSPVRFLKHLPLESTRRPLEANLVALRGYQRCIHHNY